MALQQNYKLFASCQSLDNRQTEMPPLSTAALMHASAGSVALDLGLWSFALRNSRDGLGKEQFGFPRIHCISRNYR